MADDAALAINGEHFDLHMHRHHAASERQGMGANRITKGDACSAGHGQCLLAGVGLADRGL
ncbi:hypothetical protein D3C77_695110 [compost metagenome]